MYYEIMKNIGTCKPSLVVNLFGGPGSGKSIICANTFSELKWEHISSEMALEYVKEEVWENNKMAISNQLFILGNQHQRIIRLLDQVKVILVDSPILLSILYNKEENKNLNNYILDVFNSFRNLNILIERNNEEFERKGRIHNLKESINIDKDILNLFEKYGIEYHKFKMEKESISKITKLIKENL